MAVANLTSVDFRSRDAAPKRRFDPLGLVSGWRAYRTYTELDALSDEALAARGLSRSDLPGLALEAMRRAG